jgi:hypothetical protein
MKKFVTSTLIAACLLCWAASAYAASTATASMGGQPIPKIFTADGPPQGASAVAPGGPPSQQQGSGNQWPEVTILGPASGSTFPIDSLISLSGTFTDDAGDVHTAVWNFMGLTTAGIVTEATGSVTGAISFSAPGIYYMTLSVTDQWGHTGMGTKVNGQDAVIVIYDRGYGFVSGNGKLNSPAGAMPGNPSFTGKMSFTFDARYRKDDPVPTGTTQFSVGGINFTGTSDNWFICSPGEAFYTGVGTVNGASGYAFLVSTVDGAATGVVDKLRLRITNQATGAIVYDNQMGAPDTMVATTPITNGDITVRLLGGPIPARAIIAGHAAEGADLAHGFELEQNFPNPFRASTQVRFSLPQRSDVKLAVFDVAGREVASLAHGAWDAGSHAVSWMGRTDAGQTARGGVYFVRLAVAATATQGSYVAVRKMILQD